MSSKRQTFQSEDLSTKKNSHLNIKNVSQDPLDQVTKNSYKDGTHEKLYETYEEELF